jgi:spoIIIJ-associated protein
MDPKHSVEATGEDVEAAVAAGLEELGVGPSDVLVEVLEEPSRGVFGIGARPALVRLKLLRPPTPNAPPKPAAKVSTPVDTESESVSAGELNEGTVGKEVLAELLEKMGVRANISVKPPEPTRSGEKAPWVLNINGPDMRLLIGRRGETLNSLQYILRLIVSRRLQRRANVVVDAGEYKARRSDRLTQLALRMADQAIEQQRTISLEPMPPNERRIIHMSLRNRDDVLTKSVGEGDSRKVTIVPKQS